MEIVASSNSDREIQEKIARYLSAAAQEIWTCDSFGNMEFHTLHGQILKSALFPEFPEKV